jgi:hypothetical protein
MPTPTPPLAAPGRPPVDRGRAAAIAREDGVGSDSALARSTKGRETPPLVEPLSRLPASGPRFSANRSRIIDTERDVLAVPDTRDRVLARFRRPDGEVAVALEQNTDRLRIGHRHEVRHRGDWRPAGRTLAFDRHEVRPLFEALHAALVAIEGLPSANPTEAE